VVQFFLKLVTLAKWGRQKWIRTLERLGELRKDIKESVAKQLCMDYI